jgi:copper/silver efflux system protein
VPGTRSAYADRAEGGFYLDVRIDRQAAARYGLTVADVNAVVATAIGGEEVSRTVEGRERYPISVRFARDYRADPQALLSQVLVATPAGGQVPLSTVARVEAATGPPMIRRRGLA